MSNKCVIQGDKVVPCDTLNNAVDNLYTRCRKGIFELLVTSILLDDWSVKGYGVKSGKYVKQGIMFNYCPFCGTDISSHLKTKEATEDGSILS